MSQTSSSARLRPDQRRAQILAAARQVLLADPHRELTVELVAAEAGVSPALLFHYFGSKKKFQYAVIEEAAAEVMLRTAPDPSLPPDEQLRSGIRAFVRAVLEAPQLYRATLLMSAAGDPEIRALHSDLRRVFSQWVISAVAERGIEVTPSSSSPATAGRVTSNRPSWYGSTTRPFHRNPSNISASSPWTRSSRQRPSEKA